jgi:hypothetical protein
LWSSLRFKERIASFAGTDLERIWSLISRFSAMSSVPAGASSEVALSGKQNRQDEHFELNTKETHSPIASSSCEEPQNQLLSDAIMSLSLSLLYYCAVSSDVAALPKTMHDLKLRQTFALVSRMCAKTRLTLASTASFLVVLHVVFVFYTLSPLLSTPPIALRLV